MYQVIFILQHFQAEMILICGCTCRMGVDKIEGITLSIGANFHFKVFKNMI